MIKRMYKQFCAISLFCFISFFYSSLLLASEAEQQKKLQLIQKELIDINQDLKKTQATKSKQVKKIQSFDLQISQLRKTIKSYQVSKLSTEKEIEKLRKNSASLNKSILANKKNIAEMTAAIYQIGDENYLKIILNHSDAGEQVRMRMYFEYFYQALAKQQERLTLDLAELTSIDAKLEEKIQDLNQLLEKTKKDTAALEVERKNKASYLTTLDKQIRDKKSQISGLEASRESLEKILKALKARKHREAMERKSGMSFAKNKGRLKWPVEGKLQRKYGQRRANSSLKWRGVLISAKLGANVHAIDAGTVVFADWLSGYGYVLIIDHGNSYMSLYGHNQQLLKEVGEKVKTGDVIAEAGNSGRLGKPGLYFEIRRNGKPVNPGKWMSARKAR